MLLLHAVPTLAIRTARTERDRARVGFCPGPNNWHIAMYAVMSDATNSTMWQTRKLQATELAGTYLHHAQRVDLDDVLA